MSRVCLTRLMCFFVDIKLSMFIRTRIVSPGEWSYMVLLFIVYVVLIIPIVYVNISVIIPEIIEVVSLQKVTRCSGHNIVPISMEIKRGTLARYNVQKSYHSEPIQIVFTVFVDLKAHLIYFTGTEPELKICVDD